MTDRFFWDYPVSCNAGCHNARGVGNATDYETPWGTPVHAPFAGVASPFTTPEGGNGIRLVGKDYTFVGQHLAHLPRGGTYAWRDLIAVTGNTGTKTTGPHIHAYILIHAENNRRVSFQFWLEDIARKGAKPTPAATPKPKPLPAAGRTFTAPNPRKQAYWYRSAADANALRNVHGNGNGTSKRYTSDPMLIGTYPVVKDTGRAFSVRAKDGSIVWVSGQLRGGIR